MSYQDPIADMLVRIKNAARALLPEVKVSASKEKLAILSVMKKEGYIKDYSLTGEGVKQEILIKLKYHGGAPVIEEIKRVSSPSCRIYCKCDEIPNVKNGLGTVVLSTSSGIMSGTLAKKKKLGGEILCYIW